MTDPTPRLHLRPVESQSLLINIPAGLADWVRRAHATGLYGTDERMAALTLLRLGVTETGAVDLIQRYEKTRKPK